MPDSSLIPKLDPRDFLYLAPHILLAAWGLLVLAVDFTFLRRASSATRRTFLGGLTLVGGLAALFAIAAPETLSFADRRPDSITLFFDTISAGWLTDRLDLLLIILMLMVVALSTTWDFTEHWGEYFALLLWATVGMMLLVAAEELLILFLALETMTICLYLATAFEKGRRRSAEGGLKYFVYGSVASALFLFGLSLLYGLTGTTTFDGIEQSLIAARGGLTGLAGNVAGATALLLILVGFGFKLAAVPFHQWAPDAYEGAPAPVSAWIATGSKVASVVALMKILLHALGPWASGVGPDGLPALRSPGWIGVIAAIAAATMTFGNFAALAQRNFKRMLAYSSISHGGYILVGVLAAAVATRGEKAAGAVLYYLVVYSFSTLGAFAIAAWLARDLGSDDIDDLDGLGARAPVTAVCLTLLMLSLIGVPPLAGFVGKFTMFAEALDVPEVGRVPLLWLVALGLFNSVVSAFYYVRVLKAMYFRAARGGPALAPIPGAVLVPILLSTVVVVGFGWKPAPLLDEMTAASNTPFLARTNLGGPNAPPQPRRRPARPSAPEIRMPDDATRAFAAPEPAEAPPAPTPPEPTPAPKSDR